MSIPNQEPERCREMPRELLPARGLPGLNEEWLRSVKSAEAHIGPYLRLMMFSDPNSMEADRFRLLCMQVRAMAKASKLKVMMVTSALPREGKTIAALNLATGLADRAERVAMIELDLRHPMLASRLSLEEQPGLVQCLEDKLDPLSALRRINPLDIYLLPAGKPASDPIELLNIESLARTVQHLRSIFDWVIIDAPPVIPVPDVLAIRGLADGCLWVMRAHKTSRELVREAMEQMGPKSIVGLLLNQAGDLENSYYHYYSPRHPLLLDAGR